MVMDVEIHDDEKSAKRPKLDPTTCVTSYFPQRDREIRRVLDWLMLDANG